MQSLKRFQKWTPLHSHDPYQYDPKQTALRNALRNITTFTRNGPACTNATKKINKCIPIRTQNTNIPWSTQTCSRWTNSFFSSSRQIYLPRVSFFWKICRKQIVTEHRHCIEPIKNVFPSNKNIFINLATFLFSALHLQMLPAFTSSAKMLLYAIFWNDAYIQNVQNIQEEY